LLEKSGVPSLRTSRTKSPSVWVMGIGYLGPLRVPGAYDGSSTPLAMHLPTELAVNVEWT